MTLPATAAAAAAGGGAATAWAAVAERERAREQYIKRDQYLKSPPPGVKWRRGKWTSEEEVYVNRVTEAFHQGLLPLAAGTTLRSYLSDKLNCDPMRITKKFSGGTCLVLPPSLLPFFPPCVLLVSRPLCYE